MSNHSLLGLLPQQDMNYDDDIVKGLVNVEKDGLKLAGEIIALAEQHSTRAIATLMYAASIITLLEKGVDANTTNPFSDLPVSDMDVIALGNQMHNLSTEERAAIFAREAIKLVMQANVQVQTPLEN